MMQADEAHLFARFDISDRLMEPAINSVVSRRVPTTVYWATDSPDQRKNYLWVVRRRTRGTPWLRPTIAMK